jgi:cyanophycinase
MRQNIFQAVLFLTVGLLSTFHATAADITTGPQTGTLVIVGGGDSDNAMFRHFVKIAGGKNAKLVIIPTAASSKSDYNYAEHRSARYAREALGMPNVTVVHSHDRTVAGTPAFVKPIMEADALWFTGGRQWRIADAYLETLTETEIRNVLKRGGVIGGSSAGASIQGSFLVRGDTKSSRILIGDHQRGFGFITNSAIDQHVIPRKRQGGLIEVLTDPNDKMNDGINRPALLGIGIDEGTAIVVRQNKFEVIGKKDGVVLLYNPTLWTSSTSDADKYSTLSPGAKYDLEKRIVLGQ